MYLILVYESYVDSLKSFELLNIEEFEIDNSHNTGNNLDSNKILLPNENTTNTKPLKSLKYKYISTIKPKIIKNIS